MSDPIPRWKYLLMKAGEARGHPLAPNEAVASVGLSHPDGWLDELVDPHTGETVEVDRG